MQCSRNYTNACQRHKDSLQGDRLRQFLYEGIETLQLFKLGDAPVLFMLIAVFVFFVGYFEEQLIDNQIAAIIIAIPIGIGILLCILTTFAHIIYPHWQSPYGNPLSSVIWYLFQN